MTIKALNILNYKGIGEINCDFSDNINVFIGGNGAGKSTILKCLSLGLNWFRARLLSAKSSASYITQDDFRRGCNEARVSMDFDGFTFSLSRKYNKSDNNLTALSAAAADMYSVYIDSQGKSNLPMLVSYSVNRSVIDIPKRVRAKHCLTPIDLYEEPLDAGLNLRGFFEWFQECENIENDIRSNDNPNYRDPGLQAVRRAIISCMPEYSELRVNRRSSPKGFCLRKNGVILNVNELSDGEICYLTLVGDIARRLATSNPTLHDPLTGCGIILIDEVDLHLHPQWQRDILGNLRNIFPNCQFFVTTHSPHVVQSLNYHDGDKLIAMQDGDIIPVGTLNYGSEITNILTSAFNASLYPSMIDDLYRQLIDRIDSGGDYAALKARFDELVPPESKLRIDVNFRIHRANATN